jgi:hypothetical protein
MRSCEAVLRMPIDRQVGTIETPFVAIGMTKWMTSAGDFPSRTIAEVEATLPAGEPLAKALRAVTRKPPCAGSASPEESSQSPPPVETMKMPSCATFSSSGATGASWWRQRHALIATWCVCIAKASAVLGHACASVRSISQSSASSRPLPPIFCGTPAATSPLAFSSA